MKKSCVSPNVYLAEDGAFSERLTIEIQGRITRIERRLGATNTKDAIAEHSRNWDEYQKSRRGICPNPYDKRKSIETIGQIAEKYIEACCPDRNQEPRTGKKFEWLRDRIIKICDYWGKLTVSDITPKAWRTYHDWRVEKIQSGAGDRMVDIERALLGVMFNWASAEEISAFKSPFDRTFKKFHKNPVNCRDRRPKDAEEIHKIANYFFSQSKTEVIGWQFLIECLTGCRTEEVLKFRTDTKNAHEPGHVSEASGGKVLWIQRSKKGVRNYIRLYPELEQCLMALREWHRNKYPESRWYFPSCMNPHTSVIRTTLTRGLARAVVDLNLEGDRTGHGCRAYRVCVLRSLGWDDSTIALELGHRSGAALITQVYGESTPEILGYLPQSGEPAWTSYLPKPDNIVPFQQANDRVASI